MCTANKGTQGDVASTTVTKFGSALFPHKGANGDVNQIRLIKGGKKKTQTKKKPPTLTLHITPSASLNPMREAEVSSRRGGGSCMGPAPAGENPPALPHVLWGGEGKSVFPAGIGWETRGWGQHVDQTVSAALGSALREPDAAAWIETVCIFRRTI